MAEPGSAQGGRQHRRGQHRPWAAEPRPRHGGRATRPQHGRQGGVLGRRGPRGHARRGGAAHTGVRADPVHTDHERGQHDSVAARPPDDQQVLRPRPGPRPQPRRAPPRVGAAGVRHVLAQSRCGRGGLGARHLRRRRAQALDATGEICQAEQALLFGGCSGGIISALAAAYLAGHRAPAGACQPHPRGHRPRPVRRRAGGSHDGPRPRGRGGGASRPGAATSTAARWPRCSRGCGRTTSSGTTGSTTTCSGKKPPAFDVLYWNADTTRMPAAPAPRLPRDCAGQLAASPPAGRRCSGVPVDLSAGHRRRLRRRPVSPTTSSRGRTAYRTTQLLGGATRFVLSTSGHIPALVNPTTNAKSSFRTAKENPADPLAWVSSADTQHGQLVARLRGLAGRPLRRRSAGARAAGPWSARRSRPPPARTSSTSDLLSAQRLKDTDMTSTELPTTDWELGAGARHRLLPLREQFTPSSRALRTHPRLRRRRGAARDQRVLGARRVPLAARREARRRSASSATASRATAARASTRSSAGLVHMELSRGDGSLGHLPRRAGRAGDAARSPCWAPRSRSSAGCRRWRGCEKIGAFALTEPDHGSDSVALETTARRDGDAVGHRRRQELDRQRQHRRRRGRVGARRRGRPGQGLPGREGHARLRRARSIEGKGVGARGLAGRDHARRRPRAGANRLPGAQSFKDTGRVLAATRGDVRLGGARPRRRRLRRRAHLRQAAHAVRQAARQLPDHPGAAGQDARRGHGDAALLPAARPARRGRAGSTTTLAGLAKLHNTRKARERARRRARPARRQRDPAGVPRRSATWSTSRRSTPSRAPRRCRR